MFAFAAGSFPQVSRKEYPHEPTVGIPSRTRTRNPRWPVRSRMRRLRNPSSRQPRGRKRKSRPPNGGNILLEIREVHSLFSSAQSGGWGGLIQAAPVPGVELRGLSH
jgi:hypothetical protein